MCGIVGVVGCPPEDRSVIERMTDLLHHRGPDDRGTWTSPEAHLGHTRLSILDRPKRGFNLPIRRWVRQHPGMVDHALDRLADCGVIKRPRTSKFKNEQTWTLLVLDRWLQRYGV